MYGTHFGGSAIVYYPFMCIDGILISNTISACKHQMPTISENFNSTSSSVIFMHRVINVDVVDIRINV